jgi:ABC-type proline/glycine betaine transport system permease subunit
MTALSVLGLVLLAGLAVVGIIAVLIDRARKAIDRIKYNTEHL